MKKTAYLTVLALLTPFVFTSSTCSKDCQLALCDLITEVALGAAVTVVAGAPFDVPNLISNVPETLETCQGDIIETLAAKASRSRLKVDFDMNGDGTFAKNEINNQFDVPGINSGSSATEKYSFSFDDPGQYRLITFTDDTDVNEERNEDNNASAPENLISGRTGGDVKSALIITVLPNPNFKYQQGEPRVRLLGRTVTMN